MSNPITNFKDSFGTDLGNKLITKEYLMSVYPQIAGQLITPELWVWGRNDAVQLGINQIGTRCTPITTFAGGANWKQVAGGYSFAAAIKTDGTLWTWGRNNFGQLGVNDTNRRSTPVTTFAGGTDWKQVGIAYGGNTTAAIKTNGTLWVWGGGSSGQLGTNVVGAITARTPVTTFAGGTDWKQVSTSGYMTAAIKTDGTLWIWGENSQSSLGINASGNRSTPVTTFAGGTNWKQVSVGYNFSAAVKTDGTLWTWGSNVSAKLGINTSGNRSTPVTTFAGGTNWKQVSVGYNHFAAIKTDGTLWTCGRSSTGQLGNNDISDRSTPVTTFAGGTNWKQVYANGSNTLAIKTDGTLWGWGQNTDGQLGINVAIDNRITPVTTFAGGTNWKQVSGSTNAGFAIKTSDDLLGI
jgi:alpha-tubulin suppressor-like RCC1 family protein